MVRTMALVVLTVLLASCPVGGQELQLVSDVDSTATDSADPVPIVVLDEKLIFFATTADTGRELWFTDGTEAGTELLADVVSGPDGVLAETRSAPPAVVLDGVAYFPLNEPDGGSELWKTDGTAAGTEQVVDIIEGVDSSTPRQLVVFDEHVFFIADSDDGVTLWRTDGSEDGSEQVVDLFDDFEPQPDKMLIVFAGELYFIADDGDSGVELWLMEGAFDDPVLHADIRTDSRSSTPHELTVAGDLLFFAATDSEYGTELWKTDGVDTELVLDIQPGGSSRPEQLTAHGDLLLFVADDGASGDELWQSDGTSDGTVLVDDLAPGEDSADPRLLTSFYGSEFFFVVGTELWKLNELDEAELVTDLVGDAIGPLVPLQASMLFSMNGGPEDSLWTTNGSEVGTFAVRDFPRARPELLFRYGDEVVFVGHRRKDGRELWITDGTENGTRLITDLNADPLEKPFRYSSVVIDDKYVLFGKQSSSGSLYRTDGTDEGTVLVSPDVDPIWMAAFGDGAVMSAGAPSGGGLYTSDGFEVELVFDIGGTGSAFPSRGTEYDGDYYFSADDGVSGAELWRTDGTASGTEMVADINPDGGSGPKYLTVVDDLVFFSAADGGSNRELWKTDGTEAGTELVKEIRTGSPGSRPRDFFALGDMLVFGAEDVGPGPRLWVSDGTSTGTNLVTDLASPREFEVLGDQAIFLARSDDGGVLWATDGTADGTIELAANMAITSLNPPVDGKIYFSGAAEPGDYELWVTDGTAEGTELVADIHPTGGSKPYYFQQSGEHVYFRARTPDEGTELWRTDGTEAGTELVVDHVPGTGSSRPRPLAVASEQLFVVVEDPEVGPELFVLLFEQFIRGDADGDGAYAPLLDALFLLEHTFLSGPGPTCQDAADSDNDGAISGLLDSLYLLMHGFLDGPAPSEPHPDCGYDPSPADALGCEEPTAGC